jgi:hypothetical protein
LTDHLSLCLLTDLALDNEVGGQGWVSYYGSRKADRWPRVGFKVTAAF